MQASREAALNKYFPLARDHPFAKRHRAAEVVASLASWLRTTVGAQVTAGAYVQGGADGSLGAVGDGYIDATTGVLMFARTGAEVGYKDGRVTTEFDNAAGTAIIAAVNAQLCPG